MKIVNVAEIINKNNTQTLKNEKDIFQIVSGDYVVKAIYSFTHKNFLCFVMEYMTGGDLSSLLSQYGVFDEQQSRFYIAEIILACEQLHSVGIIHRDLKPDNFLLDSKGHLKLSDFGLSDIGIKQKKYENIRKQDQDSLKQSMKEINKKFTSKSLSQQQYISLRKAQSKSNNIQKASIQKEKKKKRIIGTPDYIAPEILNNQSNLSDPTIDYWSIGVILFEMLIGIPPFNDDTVEKVFDNIQNMKIPWDEIPIGYGEDQVSPQAIDLIRKLLNPNPDERIGKKGIKEIKEHIFFQNLEWENVRNMKPPIILQGNGNIDIESILKANKNEKAINPFEEITKQNDESLILAQKMLSSNEFQMKRYDILYEENCQQIKSLEQKMQVMEEEIQQDEQELQQLEQQYIDYSDLDYIDYDIMPSNMNFLSYKQQSIFNQINEDQEHD